MTQAEKFIELASPNKDGKSRSVTFDEWTAIGLRHDNGSQWCQTDRGVGKDYTFEKQYAIINGHRRVSAIRLTGLKKNKSDANYRDHSIAPNIRKIVINRPSAILYIHSQNECDHKDEYYDDYGNEYQVLGLACAHQLEERHERFWTSCNDTCEQQHGYAVADTLFIYSVAKPYRQH